MARTADDFDNELRLHVYRFFVDQGRPPLSAESAAALSVSPAEVEQGLRRLHEAHVIVLAPGTFYVWMANPLCALPTPFVVTVGGRQWYGTCAWDALGVVAMLGGTGKVATRCPDCGDPLDIDLTGGEIPQRDHVVHYLVPARKWWDDIGFT